MLVTDMLITPTCRAVGLEVFHWGLSKIMGSPPLVAQTGAWASAAGYQIWKRFTVELNTDWLSSAELRCSFSSSMQSPTHPTAPALVNAGKYTCKQERKHEHTCMHLQYIHRYSLTHINKLFTLVFSQLFTQFSCVKVNSKHFIPYIFLWAYMFVLMSEMHNLPFKKCHNVQHLNTKQGVMRFGNRTKHLRTPRGKSQ